MFKLYFKPTPFYKFHIVGPSGDSLVVQISKGDSLKSKFSVLSLTRGDNNLCFDWYVFGYFPLNFLSPLNLQIVADY